MVEKMGHHEKPKVHFNLFLFLSCCAEGENKGSKEDDYLLEVLNELSQSKNRDVRGLYSLNELHKRLSI
jgi:hypothetical protein